MTSKFVTAEELAAHLRVNRSTIYRLMKRGQLPGFRVGSEWRFSLEEVEQLLRSMPGVTTNGGERMAARIELVSRKFCGFTHHAVGARSIGAPGIEWEVAHLNYAAEFPNWAEEAYALINFLSYALMPNTDGRALN